MVRDPALAAIARIAGAVDAPEIEHGALTTAERLEAGRFYVAVLGQFKRGKSTLINALANRALLPTGVAPVTSVVTIVRHGEAPAARMRRRDGAWEAIPIEDVRVYVSEDGNPQNERGVVAVELVTPSSLLERGLCLVDTPGLGSVNPGNTQETRDFLPHVDAALLVVGADPPITGDEARLLRGLGERVRDMFVVVAKADRASAQELGEARAFTARVLAATLPGRDIPVFAVSAQEVLATGEPTREWAKLAATLGELALGSGAALVETARKRELAALATSLRRHIDENRGALLRPVSETSRRITKLQRAADEAERALVELRHLFDAEQKQIERRLEADRKKYVTAMFPGLVAALPADAQRAKLLAAVQDECERRVRTWRDELRPRVEAEFAAAASRFATAAEEVTAKVRTSSPDTALPESLGIDTTLCVPSRFFFAPLNTDANPSLWTRLGDGLRGASGKARAGHLAAAQFAERLLEANAHGVVGDYVYRIVESRRGIERAVRDALRGAADAAVAAAARAERLRALGEHAVAAEADRLLALRQELEPIAA
ncbi:MAG TPA: dynamin family protein [Kofleriaceae bacterium]|jgi:GTP-binding protein EngB required for normal cell division